ncbi:hypothetical protein B5M43_003130 [Microbacterium sp. MEC084]|uniref:hypothetical protein n=1 Tax=Microbacterium sp. MEC084 TaxID=1963027 RepID=UPI001431F402|nr:hypothetical protein [Microbacterium sp. MEC084]MCD1267841.1 hypothetical protein [Microbacterium sp. MEC084]
MREYVEVPAGTATLVIEPMLDSASGRLSIDNVAVDSVEHVAITSPAVQPTGEVELKWTFAGLSGTPASYDIHRSTEAGFEPSGDTLVRSVPAITMAEDATTQPGTTYHYRVVAKDAAGAVLATTDAAAAATPATFVDRQLKDVLTATAEADGVRVAWRVAAGTAETYTLYSGPATLASGSLKSAKRIGSATVEAGATGLSGAVSLPGSAPAAYALVNAAGEVVASAKVADLAHPRLWIDDDKLAKVREQIAVPGEPQEIWNGILARVAGGLTATPNPYGQGFGEGEGRYAAEAALAYQVTGDASYPQKAYDGIVAAEAKLPLGTRQPLEDANPAPVLAQAYDWACNGWTDEQRANANRILGRLAAAMEVAHHFNMDDDTRASNWTGVTRGGELALRLATRGDGWFDAGETRIPMLVNEVGLHLDAAYTDTGWMQEGLEYVNYTLQIALPGIYAAQDAGITALDASIERPQFTNLYLHSLANTPNHKRLQWGATSMQGRFPTAGMIARLVPQSQRDAWVWHCERSVGSLGSKEHAGSLGPFPLIDWPEDASGSEPITNPALTQALMDDHAGAYQFRSRYQDAGDVLVGLTNRNSSHLGWEGLETFALSMTSSNVTWARQHAKAYTDLAQYSKPLIDGRPENVPLSQSQQSPARARRSRRRRSRARAAATSSWTARPTSASTRRSATRPWTWRAARASTRSWRSTTRSPTTAPARCPPARSWTTRPSRSEARPTTCSPSTA